MLARSNAVVTLLQLAKGMEALPHQELSWAKLQLGHEFRGPRLREGLSIGFVRLAERPFRPISVVEPNAAGVVWTLFVPGCRRMASGDWRSSAGSFAKSTPPLGQRRSDQSHAAREFEPCWPNSAFWSENSAGISWSFLETPWVSPIFGFLTWIEAVSPGRALPPPLIPGSDRLGAWPQERASSGLRSP